MTDWHNRVQRTQHLVHAFAALGFRCIYVNPHLGREFESTRIFDSAHRLSELENNIFELHVRLPGEPVFHDRLLSAGEEEIVASALRAILPERSQAIQILSFPVWAGVARQFRARESFPIIYDCHDLLAGFQNIAGEIIRFEPDLLRDADLVLFSSQGLEERFHAIVRRSLLVRNGVTSSQFQTGVRAPAGPLSAGYVGALDSWFDAEAVEQAARRNPDCRFLIAGQPEHHAVRKLSSLPNVELVGEVPYRQVPDFLAQLRVALIPFVINPLTLMTNPIKLYEYFSLGLPVVSSPLPEAEAMGDLVYIGANPTDFARQVTLALQEDENGRRTRRREVAQRENWMSRATAIAGAFEAIHPYSSPVTRIDV
jgi:glycosyltransferase involved in cell wall biosynthesis